MKTLQISRFLSTILVLTTSWALAEPAREAPVWNQFRGPNGSGVVNAFQPPLQPQAGQAAWTTPLPEGKSSPVLWQHRLFLTAQEKNRLVTLGIHAREGKVLWKKSAPEVPLARVHAAGSAAASTPCVDDKRLYVYFGSYGLVCYSHQGEELWKKPIPPPRNMYGISTSPIRYQDLLILVLDDLANLPKSKLSRSKVIALNPATGELVWETPRPYNRDNWSTPMIWRQAKATDLVVLGNGRVYGYNPDDGQEKWYVNGFSRETISTPIVGNGMLFVSASMQGGRGDEKLDPEPFWAAILQFDANQDNRVGKDEMTEHFTLPFRPELPPGHPGFGFPLPQDEAKRKKRQQDIFNWKDKDRDGYWTREEFIADMDGKRTRPNLAAIEPGGSGDITESHVAWNLRRGIPEIPSPVYHDNRIYFVRDGGLMSCVDATSGKVLYQERTRAIGQYSASPIIARDHVYVISANGILTVVKTGDTFDIVHQAKLNSAVHATPALNRDTLFIRTEKALMAFR